MVEFGIACVELGMAIYGKGEPGEVIDVEHKEAFCLYKK